MSPFRLFCTFAPAAFAAALAHASPDAPLGYDGARHLLARTGFGPTEAEVRALAPLTRAQAVDRLLRETRTTPVVPPPAAALDTSPLRPPRGDASAAEREAFRRQQLREGLELRGWWMAEMLATPSPLTERMTLFWHNHFVSSQQKVRIARLMYGQNATLRTHALGHFGTLLHAAAKDPAMLIYLDGVQNRKGAPNENFAREVMELFTLGEGHYGESDVKDAARAFTGWSLDRERGVFMFRRGLHDDGIKSVLGRTGRFDGDAVLDILLARPETAEFIVAKLRREFVSLEPDSSEVRRIAARFRASNLDIKVALREVLLSEAFHAADNRGTLIKSPVEVTVGTLRALELAPAQLIPFAVASAGMGQNLFSPPNVKGWPGGEAWINTNTLLARKQFLERIARADDAPMMLPTRRDGVDAPVPKQVQRPQGPDTEAEKARVQRFLQSMERGMRALDFDAAQWLARLPGDTPADKARAAQRLLLPIAPQAPPAADTDATALVRLTLLDAAYQLK